MQVPMESWWTDTSRCPRAWTFTFGLVTPTSTDMTIGVICHEIAHGLWGLTDLYDLDLSSNGIGQWGLMSYGDWNGPGKWDPYLGFAVTDGSSPALPTAWSRIVAGFDTYYMAFGPVDSTCLVPAESLPGQIYRFKSTALRPQEYFLMENRQQLTGGYDQYLPGSGMLFWHVDEAMWSIYGGPDSNSECRSLPNPHCWGTCANSHYLVALEQADGADHLEYLTNRGDSGDAFPGSTGNTARSCWRLPPDDAVCHMGNHPGPQSTQDPGTGGAGDRGTWRHNHQHGLFALGKHHLEASFLHFPGGSHLQVQRVPPCGLSKLSLAGNAGQSPRGGRQTATRPFVLQTEWEPCEHLLRLVDTAVQKAQAEEASDEQQKDASPVCNRGAAGPADDPSGPGPGRWDYHP